MGVDHPSGPGNGPETGDKPTTQGSGDKPPADDPGSSRGTPRADSLRRAGWNLEGYGETGTEQRGDRDQQTGESSTSADPTRDKRRGPGDPPAEADPESKKEPETGKPGSETAETASTDERDQDTRAADTRQLSPQTGTSEAEPAVETTTQNGHDPRTLPQGTQLRQAEIAGGSGETTTPQTENIGDKTETTGKSVPQQHTDTLPTDALASPEQLSRTEQPREQDGQTFPQQDARPPQSDSRPPEHPPIGEQTPLSETAYEGRPPQPEKAETTDLQQDEGTPETHDARPSPEILNEPPLAEQNPQATDKPPDNGPQPHHERVGDNTEQPSGPPDGQTEGATGETQTGERNAEPLGNSEQNKQIPDGQSAADGQKSQPESPEQPPAEQGEQRTADDAPRPQEAAGRERETLERQGEQDGDHGKNTEGTDTEPPPNETNGTNPERQPNPIISNVYTDSRGQVQVEPRYGREQTDDPGSEPVRNEPETTDPAGFPPREDSVRAEVGTRGRGEVGSPEDDPADRDPRKSDPEHSSRRREFRRGIFDQPGDVKKSVDTLADPIRSSFDRVPPTGQHTGAHNSTDQFKPPDHPLQAGNALLAAASVAIIVLEGARRSAKITRQLIGRHHDNHR